MPFKLVSELFTEEILLGEAGGAAEVYDVAYSTLVNGLYTVNTEFGPLILEGDLEVETR
jgi:hypothetical protein